MEEPAWAIVLAAGEGSRLRAAVQEWFGSDRPKQFCAFSGARTMLEETVARAEEVVASERVVTVVAAEHRGFLPRSGVGRLVEQPANRGTAAGVLLPAAHVLRADPSATVLILPSDHFIAPRAAFSRLLRRAAAEVRRRPERLVLLAAPAEGPETDYGWIEPAQPAAPGELGAVRRFREKPGAAEAAELLARGGLWNTMIMAVKVAALWELARRSLPALTRRFERLAAALGGSGEARATRALYEGLEAADFSRDVVEPCVDRVSVLPMRGVSWSDWGRASRILASLAGAGLPPPGRAASLR